MPDQSSATPFRVPQGLDAWLADIVARSAPDTPAMDADEAQAPHWTEVLRLAFEGVEERAVVPTRDVPFDVLMAVFIHAGRHMLGAAACAALPARAWAELETAHMLRLVRACPALYDDFCAVRDRSQGVLERFLRPAATATRIYDAFILRMRAGGWAEHLARHPVAARRCAAMTADWVGACRELLQRIHHDRARLGVEGQAVAALRAGLSDPHHGGRTVLAIQFEGGRTFAYKPRALRPLVFWNDVLAWLETAGCPLVRPILQVWDCTTHGWVGWIEGRGEADAGGVSAYFRRVGGLCAVAYVLGVRDLHAHNIVHTDSHPVLVDVESLLLPPATDAARPLARDAAYQALAGTSLLPQWYVGPDGAWHDQGGCASSLDAGHAFRVPSLQHINTDAMTLAPTAIAMPPAHNLPVHDGHVACVTDYGSDVLAGFDAVLAFLREHRAPFEEAVRLLVGENFAVRAVLRDTATYALLGDMTFAARHLGRGTDAATEFTRLVQDVLPAGASPPGERQRAAEWAALWRGDIPVFETDLSTGRVFTTHPPRAIDDGTSPLEAFPRGLARALDAGARTAAVSAKMWLTVRAMPPAADEGVRVAGGAPASTTPFASEIARDGIEVVGSDASTAVVQASSIATDLVRRAIPLTDGGVSWLELAPRGAYRQLGPIDLGLYGGQAGIALFLGALHHVHGTAGAGGRWSARTSISERHCLAGVAGASSGPDTTFVDAALAAFEPLRAGPDGSSPGTAGGVIFALSHLSQWLDRDAVLAAADRWCGALTPDVVGVGSTDVIGGAAGIVIGLLALWRVHRRDGLIDRACDYGHALLRARQPDGLWPSSAGPSLAGMAHGAAGIALALARLHSACGDARFQRCAEDAVAAENRLFDASRGGWPDVRGGWPDARNPARRATAQGTAAWCSGAAGVGLARLACRTHFAGNDAITADVEAAVDLVAAAPLPVPDHLCCGALGEVEFLGLAERRLSPPTLRAAAQARRTAMQARARARGFYRFFPEQRDGFTQPGFFQGAAGIGYNRLLSADPTLPSVLSWDEPSVAARSSDGQGRADSQSASDDVKGG